MIATTTVFSAVLLGSLGALSPIDPFLQPWSREAGRGMAAYRDSAWGEAREAWLAARDRASDPGAIDYNLGAAAYQEGDLKTALERFGVSVRSTLPPEGAAEYNLGNTLFRAQKLQEALQAYRAALRANPDDADARHNFELTLKRLEDAPPDSGGSNSGERQDSPPEDRSDQQQQSKDQAGESTPPSESGDQQEPGENANPSESPPPGEEQEPPPPQPAGDAERRPGQVLSKEEAERLLNAVTPEERELLEARLRAATRRKTEKDW